MIRGQNLGGRAAQCQREATAIAQRQGASTGQGPHGTGQLGIDFKHRLDRDTGVSEQLTDPADVGVCVDELADDFGEIRRAQGCRVQFGRDHLGARLVVNESQDR